MQSSFHHWLEGNAPNSVEEGSNNKCGENYKHSVLEKFIWASASTAKESLYSVSYSGSDTSGLLSFRTFQVPRWVQCSNSGTRAAYLPAEKVSARPLYLIILAVLEVCTTVSCKKLVNSWEAQRGFGNIELALCRVEDWLLVLSICFDLLTALASAFWSQRLQFFFQIYHKESKN